MSSKGHSFYIIVIVILLAVIAGEYFYLHDHQHPVEGMAMTANQQEPENGKKTFPSDEKGMGMSMAQVTPPAISDQQKQQIIDGTDNSSTEKTFNITGGNFYFVPNKITVNKGDKVTFVFTNAGGVHDLYIDELGVKTPVIKTAETATAKFTASKTGSFVYYCSLPGHREKGMWGTLVVQ